MAPSSPCANGRKVRILSAIRTCARNPEPSLPIEQWCALAASVVVTAVPVRLRRDTARAAAFVLQSVTNERLIRKFKGTSKNDNYNEWRIATPSIAPPRSTGHRSQALGIFRLARRARASLREPG